MDTSPSVEQSFASAMSAGKAGRWEEAATLFAQIARLHPGHRLALQGLLECARTLVSGGRRAGARERSPGVDGVISFIVCSIDAGKLERLTRDLEQHFRLDQWELVHIGDAHSLCEGYSRGLQRARGEHLVFCHDDIGLLRDDFAARLRERLSACDFLGVAGSTRLSGPAWHWAGPPHTASWVTSPYPARGMVCGLLGAAPVLRDVQAIDGVFFAGRRDVFERIRFDADTFDGFHFYDLDLSYRAHRAGLRCHAALDLLLWHESGGNFGESWQRYAARFLQKFPELQPTAAAAPFQPASIAMHDPRLIAPVYDWIETWLQPVDSACGDGADRR